MENFKLNNLFFNIVKEKNGEATNTQQNKEWKESGLCCVSFLELAIRLRASWLPFILY